MSDSRITELESKLAFQDQAIQLLSDQIYQQQRQIDHMASEWRIVTERMKELSNSDSQALDNEAPPHY